MIVSMIRYIGFGASGNAAALPSQGVYPTPTATATPSMKTMGDEPPTATVTPCVETSGMEVSQGIQDILGNVPLVAGKRTVARIFVRMSANTDLICASWFPAGVDVRGEITAWRAYGEPISTIRSMNSVRATSGDCRGCTGMSGPLLFEIPLEWASGPIWGIQTVILNNRTGGLLWNGWGPYYYPQTQEPLDITFVPISL